MKTVLLALAFINIANAAFMLAAPGAWYAHVPGVTESGPFNGHFIADIGLAFLAAGLGLAFAAFAPPGRRSAFLAAPALFLAGHSLLHVAELIGHGGAVLRDTALVIGPGLIPALIVAFQMKGTHA